MGTDHRKGGNNTEIRGWGVQFGVGGRKRRMNNRK